MQDITATLGNAQRVTLPGGGFQLRGVCFGDVKRRFKDGKFIYTTKVVEEIEPNVFKTSSGSLYRIEGWFPPSKPTAAYDPLPADWPAPPSQQR
jgi:hypothetical protein